MARPEHARLPSLIRPTAVGLRAAVVASRWNGLVVERLITGARGALLEHGARADDIREILVPGAFELPAATDAVLARDDVDVAVVLGCLLRGETIHFELIARAATGGIEEVARLRRKGVGFGLLAVDTLEQALARTEPGPHHAGVAAAVAALEMHAVLASIRDGEA